MQVRFNDVTMAYGDKAVLQNINSRYQKVNWFLFSAPAAAGNQRL